MKTDFHHLIRHRRGFTLLELVVVIAIMAVLSTVALRSMTGVASQSRFEATQRTLEQIHEAILGSVNDRQTDGTPICSGFIADAGRSPRSLDELIHRPDDLPAFDVGRSPADSEVVVAGGWRGPYVRLPVGATNLCDGWATPFVVTNTASGFVQAVVSFGANGSPGGDDVYDLDLSTFIEPVDYQASLAGQVTLDATSATNAASGSLVLSVYGAGTNRVRSASLPFVVSPFSSTVVNYAFDKSLSPGPRAIRATAFCLMGSETTNAFSSVTYLNVRSGLNLQNLTVRLP